MAEKPSEAHEIAHLICKGFDEAHMHWSCDEGPFAIDDDDDRYQIRGTVDVKGDEASGFKISQVRFTIVVSLDREQPRGGSDE